MKSRLHDITHKVLHSGHGIFHVLYLGAVSFEAHGLYGKFAFGLLVIAALGALTGDKELL